MYEEEIKEMQRGHQFDEINQTAAAVAKGTTQF